MSKYFMESKRLGFDIWSPDKVNLAEKLWKDPAVAKYICAAGVFTDAEIYERLNREIENYRLFGIQYWPVFRLSDDSFAGCCGLRPKNPDGYELGIHLLTDFWGGGFGAEACKRVLDYAFLEIKAEGVFAGHNPDNAPSQKLLKKLGFVRIEDEFYPPTGRFHFSYYMENLLR